MKKLIAGNWKMNLDRASIDQLAGMLPKMKGNADADYLVCSPFIYLDQVVRALSDTNISVGAQDCSAHDNGAHTGDISAAMLSDIGVTHVILGHSERRTNHNESDALIQQKAEKAHNHDLVTIICVGETETQRENGEEQKIVEQQILNSLPESATSANTVIAYEPVWAIGTGKTASPQDVADMHLCIRGILGQRFDDPQNVRILYGGSMKPENAAELLATPNVDGGLIGGASLKADSFSAIGETV